MSDSDQLPQDPRAAAGPFGLVRVAASAWWHTTEWAVQTGVKTGGRVLHAAVSPQAAADLAADVRQAARSIAGMEQVEEAVRHAAAQSPVAQSAMVQKMASVVPTPTASKSEAQARQQTTGSMAPLRGNGHDPETLRFRGEELLRKSSDVRHEVEAHPAFERILTELAPDEARILRLLLLSGPQGAVDVRTGGPIGMLNSRLIAPGLNMIGARAGLRYTDRVPSYLNNLFRLGLIWFSRETLRDPHGYQVLEAQPDVLGAIKSVRAAKVVRRSIHLTPFGESFCRECLSLGAVNLEALPEHAAPKADKKTAQPPAPA